MKTLLATASVFVICCLLSSARAEDEHPKIIEHKIAGKLVLIPAGEFLMGSRKGEKEARPSEYPQHKVVFKKPFYMGAYEVTYGQFRDFVKETDYKTEAESEPDRKLSGGAGFDMNRRDFLERDYHFTWRHWGFRQLDKHPVGNVSWNDANVFCRWLSNKDGEHRFRLPTEAEWEYAARGGSKTPYCWGNRIQSLIKRENVADRSLFKKLNPKSKTRKLCGYWSDGYAFTAPVGSFKANLFGLYDTHGNVSEWCEDFYQEDAYRNSAGEKPFSGEKRVYRGGSFRYRPGACRVARRHAFVPTERKCLLGFRVLRELD